MDGKATAVEAGRVGDEDRDGDDGVTSVWRMDVKIAFACSLSASDSVGMMRLFDGVAVGDSSIRWYAVRISPISREGTNRSP